MFICHIDFLIWLSEEHVWAQFKHNRETRGYNVGNDRSQKGKLQCLLNKKCLHKNVFYTMHISY